DGAATLRTNSVANGLSGVGITDGQRVQVRVTLDVDNGAGGCDVTVAYRTDGVIDSGTGWTTIGSTITNAFTTSINGCTAAAGVVMGSFRSDANGNVAPGD